MAKEKLIDVLKAICQEVPDVIAIGVIGSDGLVISQVALNPDFDMEMVGAQMALLMGLVKRALGKLGEEIDDDLLTTDKAYLLTSFLGDEAQYQVGMALPYPGGSLGVARMVMKEYKERLWNALPGR